jgi:hypothetical protein
MAPAGLPVIRVGWHAGHQATGGTNDRQVEMNGEACSFMKRPRARRWSYRLHGDGPQAELRPPSILMIEPVTDRASSVMRYTARAATSSGVTRVPRGTLGRARSM